MDGPHGLYPQDKPFFDRDPRIDFDQLLANLARICTRLSREEKKVQEYDCQACLRKKERQARKKEVSFLM